MFKVNYKSDAIRRKKAHHFREIMLDSSIVIGFSYQILRDWPQGNHMFKKLTIKMVLQHVL